jgi:hypothetical protein
MHYRFILVDYPNTKDKDNAPGSQTIGILKEHGYESDFIILTHETLMVYLFAIPAGC